MGDPGPRLPVLEEVETGQEWVQGSFPGDGKLQGDWRYTTWPTYRIISLNIDDLVLCCASVSHLLKLLNIEILVPGDEYVYSSGSMQTPLLCSVVPSSYST